MKIITLYIEKLCPVCRGQYNQNSTIACSICFGEGVIREIIDVADYKELK